LIEQLLIFLFFVVLGIKPRASCVLGKFSTPELHLQPQALILRGAFGKLSMKVDKGTIISGLDWSHVWAKTPVGDLGWAKFGMLNAC
jgi:hypothetical protein